MKIFFLAALFIVFNNFGMCEVCENYEYDKEPEEQSALHEAARYYRPDRIRRLLDMPDVDVNTRNSLLQTPLHVAAQHGIHTIVELLLGIEDIAVNAKDIVGWTPLHYAARFCKDENVKSLLGHRDTNAYATNNDGATPLHVAVGVKVVKLLLVSPLSMIELSNQEIQKQVARFSNQVRRCLVNHDQQIFNTLAIEEKWQIMQVLKNNHLLCIKQIILLENNAGKSAIEIMEERGSNIAKLLNEILAFDKFEELNEELKNQIEEGYQRRLYPSEYWTNAERALSLPLLTLDKLVQISSFNH